MAASRELMDHLNHVAYPMKGSDLKIACDSWSDVPEGERHHAESLDPEKTYNSADEVLSDLGESAPAGTEHQM